MHSHETIQQDADLKDTASQLDATAKTEGVVNLPKTIYVKRESGVAEFAPEGAPLPYEKFEEFKFAKKDDISKSAQLELVVQLFEEDSFLGNVIVSEIPDSIQDGDPVLVGIKVTPDFRIIASAYLPTVNRECKTVFSFNIESLKNSDKLLMKLEALKSDWEELKLILSQDELARVSARINRAFRRTQECLSGNEPDTTEASRVVNNLGQMIRDLKAKGPLILQPSKEEYNNLLSKREAAMDERPDIIKTLSQIREELKDKIAGHVSAYKYLISKADPHKLEALYSDEAEREWKKVHENNPNDWLACHHLAILYHAKAFDCELEGEIDQAVECWKKAHHFWHKLLKLNEPIDTFHGLLQKMERYKAEEQEAKFEELKNVIIYDLLNVHQKLYAYYIAQKEPAIKKRAEHHYSLLEKSPFKEASEIIKSIYEKKYGDRVRKLVTDIRKKSDNNHKIASLEETDALYDEIAELSKKRKALTVAWRDLVILASWKLRLALTKWILELIKLNEAQSSSKKNLKRLYEEITELRAEVEELKRLVQRDYGRYSEFQELANKHDDKVREFQSLENKLNSERKRHFDSMADLLKPPVICESHLESLSSLNDDDSMQTAAIELQEAISEFLLLEQRVGGIGEFAIYRELEERCSKLAQKIKALRPKSPLATPSQPSQNSSAGIWSWIEFKKQENPYYNTSFLLLDTELPSISQEINIRELLKKMKLKKKNLEPKAKAGKHEVLGRHVKLEDLNKVIAHLDSPIELAQDMLLQHQAHHANTDDIKEKLSHIELPAPENVPLELSPGVFSLFSIPRLSETSQRRWKKPPKESLDRQTKPKLDWPS